jgi:F-box/WD-40 domain protein 7
MRHRNIELNWRVRPIPQPRVLKGHDDHVITCLQFCGNRIVSGSDDNTLKVWSATTGKVIHLGFLISLKKILVRKIKQ